MSALECGHRRDTPVYSNWTDLGGGRKSPPWDTRPCEHRPVRAREGIGTVLISYLSAGAWE